MKGKSCRRESLRETRTTRSAVRRANFLSSDSRLIHPSQYYLDSGFSHTRFSSFYVLSYNISISVKGNLRSDVAITVRNLAFRRAIF
jgi:hypothetical protein